MVAPKFTFVTPKLPFVAPNLTCGARKSVAKELAAMPLVAKRPGLDPIGKSGFGAAILRQFVLPLEQANPLKGPQSG
jgi:hypothetical protein